MVLGRLTASASHDLIDHARRCRRKAPKFYLQQEVCLCGTPPDSWLSDFYKLVLYIHFVIFLNVVGPFRAGVVCHTKKQLRQRH